MLYTGMKTIPRKEAKEQLDLQMDRLYQAYTFVGSWAASKLKIPYERLEKPSKLTDEQFEKYKTIFIPNIGELEIVD